jgi:hypothetical protein
LRRLIPELIQKNKVIGMFIRITLAESGVYGPTASFPGNNENNGEP